MIISLGWATSRYQDVWLPVSFFWKPICRRVCFFVPGYMRWNARGEHIFFKESNRLFTAILRKWASEQTKIVNLYHWCVFCLSKTVCWRLDIHQITSGGGLIPEGGRREGVARRARRGLEGEERPAGRPAARCGPGNHHGQLRCGGRRRAGAASGQGAETMSSECVERKERKGIYIWIDHLCEAHISRLRLV